MTDRSPNQGDNGVPQDAAAPARGAAACSSATTCTATSVARDELVERFLPLARRLVRRFERTGRADRGSDAGREPRARQGGGPLRARARHRLLELRRADHRRRAQALLPRRRLGRARAARPAGARARGQPRAQRPVARPGPLAHAQRGGRGHRPRRRRTCSRRWRRRWPTTPSRSRRRCRAPATGPSRWASAITVEEEGYELAEDAAMIAPQLKALEPRGSPDPAPALRRGHDAVGDSRADRRLADARVPPDPRRARAAPARRRRIAKAPADRGLSTLAC